MCDCEPDNDLQAEYEYYCQHLPTCPVCGDTFDPAESHVCNDCYTIEGVSKSGYKTLLYAGPSRQLSYETMEQAAETGEFQSFDSKWWCGGDCDGCSYIVNDDKSIVIEP